MAPKRKADQEAEDGPWTKSSKTTGKSADKLGLTYKDFKGGAKALQATIATKGGKDVLVDFDLPKTKMSSGSFGWSGANKRINVEVEVDSEMVNVQAQVTLNITVLGSKKMTQGDKDEGTAED